MNPTLLNSSSFKPDSIPIAFAAGVARQVLLDGGAHHSDPEPTPAIQMPVELAGFTGRELAGLVVSPASRTKLIPERAGVTRLELNKILLDRCDAHSHWGLNE